MSLKERARQWMLDTLGRRDDRCYWRQPTDKLALPEGATVCMWQPDGKLGDAVLNSMWVHDLLSQRPDLRIIVASSSALQPFWAGVPGVHQALSCEASGDALTRPIENCDVLVSFETFVSVETLRLIRRVKPHTVVGFSVGRYRLFDFSIVDTTYEHPRRHMVSRLHHLDELMGLRHLGQGPLPTMAPKHVTPRVHLPPHQGPTVFLNTYAAAAHRSFNASTTAQILAWVKAGNPSARVVISRPDGTAQHEPLPEYVQDCPKGLSPWELIALVSQCDVVITPDTALAHIGAALDRRVAVFYADTHYNPVVWAPLCATQRQVLPVAPGDVNRFDAENARQAVTDMVTVLPKH